MEAIRHFTMLVPDRAMEAWSSHERLYVREGEMSPYLRYYNENYNPMLPIPAPTGIGQYGAFSIVKENTSESKSKGSSINFYGVGFGTTTSNAVSRQLNDFRDVNGDGYPDILGDKIQLTSYRGGLTSTILNKNLLGTTTSDGSGTTAGGSDAHIVALADPGGNFTKVRIGNSATFSGGLNASGQIFQTSTRPESVLVDLNGDGLPDLVKADNEVEFNDAANFVASTWEGYTEPGLTKTYSPGKSIGFGGGFTEFVDPIVIGQDINAKSSSNLDLSVGFSDSRSATHSEKDFVDFNGDGLPDYISGNSIHFNTGTYHLTGSYNLPRMSESSVTSQGFVINASVLIPITIVPLQIIVKVGGGGGKSWGTNYSEENVSLRDFDGDGYVDIVESASETQVKVRFSKIGRTNMLKMVHNPTGSTIEMDYATNNVISGEGFGPTYKMPFKKWVLSKVTVNDGFRGDGADEQKFAFEYQNGLKDRRERKFLGFGEVKTHQLKGDDNPAIYRTVVQKYLLDDMPSSEIYLPGDHTDSRKYQYIGNLLKEESTYDGTQRLLNKTEYDYAVYSIGVEGSEYYQTEFPIGSFSYTDTSRILPLVKSTVDSVFHYNGNGASPFKADVLKTLFKEYDKYGNVTRYYDDFDGNNVEIRYDEKNTASQYIVNIPILHNVNNGERYSTAETDGVGNIITINRFKNGPTGSDVATTDMEYNSLGQLTKVTQPKPQMSSNNSERMFYEYTYDDTFKLFVTEVTDAYGFTGSTEYDHFGMPLKQTDLNGTEFEYIYDPLRRVTQFKGPYNDEWTIKNEYKKDTATGLLYAVTQHNITDETVTGATQQVLHTSSFADGLGRIIQTKKQLAPEDDPNCTTPGNGYRFATSGLQVYDVFGRVVESFLGQEELDCTGNFITALETYTPLTHTTQEKTTIAYDVRDRVLQNHVHGLNATTEYKYGFEDDGTGNVRAYERVTLPEGNVSVTYKDEKGRVRTTKQIDSGMQLLTQYRYDMLGQLEKVTDAEGKETLYEYDNFGQKTKTTHPDNGITEFTYDLTGKLTASASQNLIAQGQEITYTYNFNQLVNIAYPAFVANGQSYPGYNVDYSYGGVGAPDFAAGRITQVNDLTGRKTFKYGALGEVLEDTRQLTGATGTMEFTTGYRYDSWGRIMEMTYPDGEHLEYGYNSAGQLKSIFSDTENQWYLKDVTYTFFEQPAEITYGNDVVTKNEYDITQRVRAMQLDRPDTTTFMRNVYAYDRNQNITNITNSISQHNVLQMGGTFDKNYTYDGFNRLKNASGTWQGYNEHHDYTLAMEYTNTHGIKNKNQFHDVTSTAFTGESENSYDAVYQYTDTAHPHAVSSIAYTGIGGTTSASSQFTYDANGNMTHYQSSFGSFNDREMIWDQQNRLLAVVDDNARVSHYIYDHAGERTFKAVGTVATVSIGGQDIYSVLDFDQYTLYPSGYMVVEPAKGEYSKHYYINGKRFVSRLENNIDQFAVGTGAKGAYATTAAETTATENTGMDLAGMVGAQNTIYSIETPGNDPDDCQQQLDDIVTQYQNGGATVAHCLNAIQEIIDRYGADSPCEALVEVNQYVCTEVDPNDPGNVPDDPNDPVLSPGEMEAADCLTDLNILIAHFAAQIQNGEGSAFFEWYQCIDACIERNDIVDSQGCWERLTVGNGEWPESCNAFYRDCDCGDQPVISELLKCPALAMIYIDTHLAADLSNACAVLNYVKENFNCVPLPEEPEPDPVTPGDISDDWIDDGGNTDDPDDDYDEYQRKPIWWYHTDHLGSSTYLTDNFGRPSHYYETLPFGEMMVEHNQSKYYKSPYPTTNTGSYDNKYKFNGKELDDATGMYYYGSRYYDPRISIFISVDPLAEKFTGWTPYHYVHNNPVNMIDPTGMEADHIIVNENNEIVGGEMDGDLNIYRGKQDENGNWVKTDEVVGQLVNDYQGFRYNEKGGFEGFAEGAKLHTGNVKGFCSGKGLLTSLNNQFEKEIEGPGGYIAALAQLAVDSRGPSGLGPLKGSGKYDIKNTLFGGNFYDLYQYEDGTYITPRSMGNMLFGANARTIFNNKVNALDKQKYDSKWFYSFFMQKAGGYNTRTNNTQGTGGWPFYGEHQGSGTSIFEGYFKGL
ncbi:RHS repeat-associated core domain-containing protein [Paenimyroides marinum]|nr:RHS repeat-associated core domain-containing protein [Paenimyroides aquimaris]